MIRAAQAQGLPPWQLPDMAAARAEWEALPGRKPWLNFDVEEISEWWPRVQGTFAEEEEEWETYEEG